MPMPGYAAQHYVPNSYLKPWCDPDSPPHQTPYVWRFTKDGTKSRKKAPQNIFTETDIYTVSAADGSRDLTLEHLLGQLENDYCHVRERLLRSERITQAERGVLCAFAAAAQARTKVLRDHHARQWSDMFEMMNSMQAQIEEATPSQQDALARSSTTPTDSPATLSFEDVRTIVEQPMAALLGPTVTAVAPLLRGMHLGLLRTHDQQGFITSDNPCVWFDPALSRLPPSRRNANLASHTIEVLLPIAPTCMLLFNRKGFDYSFPTGGSPIQFYNRLLRLQASEYFVNNRNSLDPFWFDQEAGERINDDDVCMR